MTLVRTEITPPQNTNSIGTNGFICSLSPDSSKLYVLVKRSTDASGDVGLMVSNDNGATWAVDGLLGDFPLPLFQSGVKGLIYKPDNGQIAVWRFSSGRIQWHRRSGPGIWESREETANVVGQTFGQGDAAFDATGVLHGLGVDTTTGINDLYYVTSDGVSESIVTDNGPFASDGFTWAKIILDSNNRPHVLFHGKAATARSSQDTIWYMNKVSGSWTSPVSIGSTGADETDEITPQIDSNGNIYVGYVSEGTGSVFRMFYAVYDGSSWTSTQVDTEWVQQNTDGVITQRDAAGKVWLCSVGRVDSVQSGVAQMYYWGRASSASSFTRGIAGQNSRDIGSSQGVVITGGSQAGGVASSRIPGGGFYIYALLDWDTSVEEYWWFSVDLVLSQGNDGGDSGSSTQTGGSVAMDHRTLKSMRAQIASTIQDSSTSRATGIDLDINSAYQTLVHGHVWPDLIRERELDISATANERFLYLPKDCGKLLFIFDTVNDVRIAPTTIANMFQRHDTSIDEAGGLITEFARAGTVGRKAEFHTSAETISVSSSSTSDSTLSVLVKGYDSSGENVIEESVTLDSSGDGVTSSAFSDIISVSTTGSQAGTITYSGTTSSIEYGTIAPDEFSAVYDRIRLYQIPNDARTLTVYYVKTVGRLLDDNSIPEVPISEAIVAMVKAEQSARDRRMDLVQFYSAKARETIDALLGHKEQFEEMHQATPFAARYGRADRTIVVSGN